MTRMTVNSLTTPRPRFQGSVYLKNESQMAPDLRAAAGGLFNRFISNWTKPEIAVVFSTTITGSDETNNLSDKADVYRSNQLTGEKEGLQTFTWDPPAGLLGFVPFARTVSRLTYLYRLLSYAKQLNDPNFPPKPGQPETEPLQVVHPGLEGVLRLPAPGSKHQPATGATQLNHPTAS